MYMHMHLHMHQVAILDKFFSDGAAYCMGSLNKDCWYMYTLNPLDRWPLTCACFIPAFHRFLLFKTIT